MLLMCGVGVIVAFAFFILFAVWHGKMSSRVVFAVGMMGIVFGIVVTNLSDIAGLVLQLGEKQFYGFQWKKVEQAAKQIDTQAKQVQTDTTEVRQMKEQIVDLLKRVEQGEQNVSCMGDTMRETWRALFDSISYVLMTKDIHTPHAINESITKDLMTLAALGYPDPEERHRVVQQVLATVREAHGQESAPK